ncbi:MAG: hypothetical protein JWR83_973, partial [Aeromicrobium sp.]|nr:hypothetical protein [Aeromicrobium sp.]
SQLQGLASGWLRDLEGTPTNDRSPSDVAFHTLREYVPGDDRRHVHWRTSARLGKLMVRQFIDNRRSHLGILIDSNPADYADADEFELAVSMAASLGLRAIMDGQEISCAGGRGAIPAHTGQVLLDGLSRIELGVPMMDLQEIIARDARAVKAASVIAIVTGSAIGLADVQRAAQRLGAEPGLMCVRAAQAEDAGLMRAARMRVLTADSLDAFTRVMWSVGTS